MKNITILGSTGSIGTQVLDVVSRLPDRLRVVGLAAHRNVELLAEQIHRFHPAVVSLGDEKDFPRLLRLLGDARPEMAYGPEGLAKVAAVPDAQLAVISVAGTVGLAPTLQAIEAGKDIALASKEVLVAAGSPVTKLAAKHGVKLLPIDSEHSAIFQCMQGEDPRTVRRLMLTASGGALAKRPLQELAGVTVEDALAHPTWSMGRKITIDSATLMNKALEIVEAMWLFGVDPSRIEVVIHPQSIVHSMVEFEDGSVKAQLGIPDMRIPIQYALLYPERPASGLPALDLSERGILNFAKPDRNRYPALDLGYEAAGTDGTMPAVMNAANETAVAMFLNGEIGFLDICRTVRRVMDAHAPIPEPDLECILAADQWARHAATSALGEDID